MYYYVAEDNIKRERREPGTTHKKMVVDHGLYLWNQAMFVLAQLLTAGLLHINELDPIRRYLPSYNRPRKGGRYSAFQVKNCSILSWSIHLNINLLALVFLILRFLGLHITFSTFTEAGCSMFIHAYKIVI